MLLEAKKLRGDMRPAAELISKFVAAKTLANSVTDGMLRSAVEQ